MNKFDNLHMAFNNGVQFVCSTNKKGITIGLADEEKYDYPIQLLIMNRILHAEENSGDKINMYKLRNAEFLNLLGEAFNSARYQELDSRVFELENAESYLEASGD